VPFAIIVFCRNDDRLLSMTERGGFVLEMARGQCVFSDGNLVLLLLALIRFHLVVVVVVTGFGCGKSVC